MTLKALAIVGCLVIGKNGASQVEAPNSNFKTNTVSLYYPTYFFFDNISYGLEHPLENIGVYFQRFKTERKIGWHVSVDHYGYTGNLPSPLYLGNVYDRDIAFLSLGLDSRLITKGNLALRWYGEFNHRLGYEYYYAGGSGINWSSAQRKLIDFGLSIGTKFSYRFPFGLVASISVKQSFYYYRFDRGVDYWTFEDGSPRNVLNLNFGVGWNF